MRGKNMRGKDVLPGLAFAMGLLSINSIQAATLVAEYAFNDAADLGLDSSGLGNNATNVSNVTQGAGPSPGTFGAQFVSDSLFGVVGGLTGYDGVPGFSYSLWVNVASAIPDALHWSGLVDQDFSLCCTDRLELRGGVSPYIDAGAHQDVVFAQDILPINNWYFVALTAQDTASGTDADVYVDGQLIGTAEFSYSLPDLTGVNTWLGSCCGGGNDNLIGSLSDVRIYQGALTPSEIEAIYTGVPEPGAWATILLGFGMIGAALRMRRHALDLRRQPAAAPGSTSRQASAMAS